MQNYLEKEQDRTSVFVNEGGEATTPLGGSVPDFDTPPAALGIINDTVGVIPAGPHNPEIFYTPDGEEVAAAVLLTLRLFPQHLIDHLNLGRTRIICAQMYDEQSEQIYQNLFDNFPLGKISPDVISIDQDNKKEYEQTIGMANAGSNTLQIFETSSKSSRQNMGAAIQSFLQQHRHEEAESIPPELMPEYDDLYLELNYLEKRKELSLTEVLSVLDDLQECRLLMQGLPEKLSHVPMTLAHEISHLSCVQHEVFLRGARADISLIEPDYEQNFEIEDAKKFPAFFRKNTQLREQRLSSYANTVFQQEVLAPERLLALSNTSNLGYKYFLSSEEESVVELAGCALVAAMNEEHGTDIRVSKLARILPDSFHYVARWVAEMPAVQAEDMDEALTDFDCPDQQLLPREDWLELRAQQFDLD